MKTKRAIGFGLMLASAGSGYLDVLCYRSLGEVLPSAMTGNLALLGRGLGEADVTAAGRNLCAFIGFFGGAALGGALLRGTPGKGRFLLTLAVQGLVLAGFAVFWDRQAQGLVRFGLIAAAAIGMGVQSAVAHGVGLHAVSTTYFTGTTANIAFGLLSADGPKRLGWPVLALCCYLGGAALAGWFTAGRSVPALPLGLQALPVLTTAVLALVIAAARIERAADSPS